MLYKTRAVSLSYIRYKESSIIARFFTEEFGIQSFVVNGVRSVKAKTSPALFQPLGLMELVQYHDQRKELHRLSEIKAGVVLKSIPFSPVKAAIAMFTSEYLGKVVTEGQANPPLFSIVWDWVQLVDNLEIHFESQHIALVWQSMAPLGISPADWQDLLPLGSVLDFEQKQQVGQFFTWLDTAVGPAPCSGSVRQWVLDLLIRHCQDHMEGMGSLQSIGVLRSVFSA